MRPTLTKRYTRMHRALLLAAGRGRIRPSAARVLLAIADRGGQTVGHADLAADLKTDGGHVRASLLALYARGLATGTGVDGGARRPFTASGVRLTAAGDALVDEIRKAAGAKS